MDPAIEKIILDLALYLPSDTQEAHSVGTIQTMAFEGDILSQENEAGHLTGSALVVDLASEKVLLHYHKKLERWLQFGGHMDADETNPAQTAMREAQEESGLEDLVFLGDMSDDDLPLPIDIDVHTIPARGDVPEHLHLDFRYVVTTQTPNTLQVGDDESDQFRWMSIDEAHALEDQLDHALHRLIDKALNLMQNQP